MKNLQALAAALILTNFDSKGTKWSANVRATNLMKMFFIHASFNVNRRQSKIRSLHRYEVLWIHWCVVYCSSVILIADAWKIAAIRHSKRRRDWHRAAAIVGAKGMPQPVSIEMLTCKWDTINNNLYQLSFIKITKEAEAGLSLSRFVQKQSEGGIFSFLHEMPFPNETRFGYRLHLQWRGEILGGCELFSLQWERYLNTETA